MPCWWCVCASDHQSLSTSTHMHRDHTFTKTCFQHTYTGAHTHTHICVWPHTCVLSLMSPLPWQGTNQSWVQKFKGVKDCLVCFSLCYWSHFTGIIAKLSRKPRDGAGLKVDDWERRQGDIHCNLSPHPTPPSPSHRPSPNTPTNPMTLKVRIVPEVFGAESGPSA